MHSVADGRTDRQTDRRTEDMMMPIAVHTIYQYDLLNTNQTTCNHLMWTIYRVRLEKNFNDPTPKMCQQLSNA